MPSRIDLTGRRFGKLRVIGSDGYRRRKAWWRCQCDCGGSICTFAYALTNGEKYSCGCVSTRRIDLAGQLFGRLLVLGFEGYRKKRSWWKCLCEACGRTTAKTTMALRSGIKSCGCLSASASREAHSKTWAAHEITLLGLVPDRAIAGGTHRTWAVQNLRRSMGSPLIVHIA